MSIIFDDRKIEYRLVDDIEVFKEAALPKLAYSENRVFKQDASIYPSTLLFENEIVKHIVLKAEWNSEEVLSFDGVPDILGSIFYIISLYDDYLQEETDKHDRNIGSESLLFKMNWLNQLIVERWSEQLISFIETQTACSLNAEKIPFKVIPTFDIDNVYAYRLKKGWRKYMSIAKDVLKNNRFRLKERKSVLAGQIKDPYDTYDKIEAIAKRGFDVKFFWLLGEYGTYDRNVDYHNINHRRLIFDVDKYANVGLHPSYRSNQSKTSLRDEKLRIEEILNREVTHTRQHFLKVKLPITYTDLEKVGFTDDYSLGYADQLGFRAGVARPFMWYNLLANEVSALKLHPISYMDGTLNEYMELTIDEAINTVQQLKKEVQTYGGNLVALWHNETIGDYGRWKGWSKVLEETLSENK
ncbi:MAG TPA: polysaccharide deacetylase family protein [Brumimicrobium sp.]|nr:polysaccharide deacetylase family protein [Brumimicrobium sp.]